MKNLSEARDRIGLSQAELAEKLRVNQQTISSWERGRSEPLQDQEKELRIVLGIDEAGGIPDSSPLAAWLSSARSGKGWSVPELAHRAGLTPPAVYRIESGVTRNVPRGDSTETRGGPWELGSTSYRRRASAGGSGGRSWLA